LELAKAAAQALADKKGENICLMDVGEHSSITEYFLIVSGSSPPHLKALFQTVQRDLKDKDVRCYRKAGTPDGGWLVLDYVDVVIHIFREELRMYYAIEELWNQAPRVDLPDL